MAYVKDQGIFGDQQTIKVAAAWILGTGWVEIDCLEGGCG